MMRAATLDTTAASTRPDRTGDSTDTAPSPDESAPAQSPSIEGVLPSCSREHDVLDQLCDVLLWKKE
eukprot:7267690-Prymnesium_polylepis.2